MKKGKLRNVFTKGAITPQFIADAIAGHQSKTTIGAHDIFLGQVRADILDGAEVKAIECTAYEEMANQKFHEIREAAFAKYRLSCMHIHHSLGVVPAGAICLFVFVSAPHRKDIFGALSHIVEEIKKEVPIFGKEIFEDSSYQWKVNN